jgi:hypothetical protein
VRKKLGFLPARRGQRIDRIIGITVADDNQLHKKTPSGKISSLFYHIFCKIARLEREKEGETRESFCDYITEKQGENTYNRKNNISFTYGKEENRCNISFLFWKGS